MGSDRTRSSSARSLPFVTIRGAARSSVAHLYQKQYCRHASWFPALSNFDVVARHRASRYTQVERCDSTEVPR